MAGSSSHHIRNICVFGGSSPGKEKEFLESANHLGRVLAERKIHLVYGGGSLGLMGGVSMAAFLGGSQVLGVVPKASFLSFLECRIYHKHSTIMLSQRSIQRTSGCDLHYCRDRVSTYWDHEYQTDEVYPALRVSVG